jgi:hypothetical protein
VTLIPTGVVIVIVLAAACVVLGAVYGYIYFTRVDTRSTRTDKKPSTRKSSGARRVSFSDQHGHTAETGLSREDSSCSDRTSAPLYTHMFLFRKHHHNPTC